MLHRVLDKMIGDVGESGESDESVTKFLDGFNVSLNDKVSSRVDSTSTGVDSSEKLGDCESESILENSPEKCPATVEDFRRLTRSRGIAPSYPNVQPNVLEYTSR
jgi:hypothetical protein